MIINQMKPKNRVNHAIRNFKLFNGHSPTLKQVIKQLPHVPTEEVVTHINSLMQEGRLRKQDVKL